MSSLENVSLIDLNYTIQIKIVVLGIRDLNATGRVREQISTSHDRKTQMDLPL